jgi:hypothetical protein
MLATIQTMTRIFLFGTVPIGGRGHVYNDSCDCDICRMERRWTELRDSWGFSLSLSQALWDEAFPNPKVTMTPRKVLK